MLAAKPVKRQVEKNKLIASIVVAIITVLLLGFLPASDATDSSLYHFLLRVQADRLAVPDKIIAAAHLLLLAILAYLAVRALNTLFSFLFRLRQGFEAPTLAQNVF